MGLLKFWLAKNYRKIVKYKTHYNTYEVMKFVFLACFSGLYTFQSNRLITYFGIISSIENAVNKYLNIASKINLV